MFATDYSLRNVALAASFTALIVSATDAAKDLVSGAFDVKESISKNWIEFNYIPSGFNSSYSNAKINNAFIISPEEEEMIFELDSFLVSVQDGSIFDDVSDEVWALADKIIESNSKITNFI